MSMKMHYWKKASSDTIQPAAPYLQMHVKLCDLIAFRKLSN